MRWTARFQTAWFWLDVAPAWRDCKTHLRVALECAACAAAQLVWIAAAPLVAFYGVYRPTQLFRLVQWLRDPK